MGIKKPVERKNQSYIRLIKNSTAILDVLHKRGDTSSARKVAEITKKLVEEDLTVAFCGHFSAGKSSFINELLQESILPASPIPTSANVVKIQSGEEMAHVYFFEGEALQILPPVSFENVKAYCKDGDQVQAVAYQYPFKNLPNDLTILDTPGVDSTDDAHRVSTESALHLADVIFYVMDYNHVQSEVNLKFIKELQDKEKKIYLVVNQMDKHREEEIPFAVYQKRIQESFADWGIAPSGLYYTSLKEQNHPLNDLDIVKETIQLLRQKKMDILPKTAEKALLHILEEHKEWLLEKREEELMKHNGLLQVLDGSENEVFELLMAKKEELYSMEKEDKQKKETFYNQIKQILDNANITPYEMRELAEKYLESKQKGFKVGLIFAGKKTIEEQEKRLALFKEDVAERVKTQIEKFVHEHIFSFLKENGLYHPEVFEKVQSITADLNESYISDHVKPGAGAAGDAVLHYTKDLAHSIKRDYHKLVHLFMDEIFQQMEKEIGVNKQSLKEEIRDLVQHNDTAEAIKAIHYEIEAQFHSVFSIIFNENVDNTSSQVEMDLINFYLNKEFLTINGDKLLESLPEKKKDSAKKEDVPSKPSISQENPSSVSQALKRASLELKNIQGFQSVVHELRSRAEKLDNQSFTVALFGAFSAGKSSFANALFGEKILPVSPNPTTASINKISPVTKEHPHGTVCVKMKSDYQLLQDVNHALSLFQVSTDSLEEAQQIIIDIINRNDHIELDANKKPHFHFLKAFIHGWEQMKSKQGIMITVPLSEFEAYVAQEEKSCFVEWIEVFYDCPLTREGLTLVDTPGADSINARHTDVSFEYIKNADAILFVTYYQHAFSKADREFLIQLGRVKDAFSLDKMFFLVNAADLANNEEELKLVCDYVQDQLTVYGIRHPRLFPVSSKLALKEKEGEAISHPFLKDSLISQFNRAFSQFIRFDLISMSVHAAKQELERSLALLENYIKEAMLGKEEKEEKRAFYKQNKAKIVHSVSVYKTSSFHTLLQKEINELLYYVKQRTLLRFSDFFKESFNPAVLKEDGRNIKAQLAECLLGFVHDIEHNLSQEVRATTVRIENYIQKSLINWQKEMEQELHRIEKSLSFTAAEVGDLQPLKFSIEFPSLPAKAEKQTLGYFKNSKAFFEKNEKQKLSRYLEEQISPLMDQFLAKSESELLQHYEVELDRGLLKVKGMMEQEIAEFYKGMEAALSNEINIGELKEVYQNIKSFY